MMSVSVVYAEFHAAVIVTFSYWLALYEWVIAKRSYAEGSMFREDLWARVQIYSLSLIFNLWDKEHYRSSSFQQDMKDNLSNVAIPGTGIQLSVFCYSWHMCFLFVLFVNPLVCFCGAFNKV